MTKLVYHLVYDVNSATYVLDESTTPILCRKVVKNVLGASTTRLRLLFTKTRPPRLGIRITYPHKIGDVTFIKVSDKHHKDKLFRYADITCTGNIVPTFDGLDNLISTSLKQLKCTTLWLSIAKEGNWYESSTI